VFFLAFGLPKEKSRTESVAQVVEPLPSKCEALSSKPIDFLGGGKKCKESKQANIYCLVELIFWLEHTDKKETNGQLRKIFKVFGCIQLSISSL
jgi:hypothetical protein